MQRNAGMKPIAVTVPIALSLALFIGSSMPAAMARDWCANDCISLCKKTAVTQSWQACVEQFQCTKRFPPSPCAGSAGVAQRAVQYRAGRSGSGPMTFDACLQRGIRAGWGAAETSAYCQAQR